MVGTTLIILGIVGFCRFLFLHWLMGAVVVTAIEDLGGEIVLLLGVSVNTSGSLVDNGVLGVGELV